MQLSELYPAKYLKSADVVQPRTLQIQTVQMELIGQQKDNKPVLYFAGEPKGLVMNKTIASQIAYLTRSEETERWRGCWVELHQDMTQFQGRPTECIRVRAPHAPAAPPAPNGGQYPPPQQPPYVAPPQQPRPGMAPPNAVTDALDDIPDPGDPMTAYQRQQADRTKPPF